MPSSGVKKCALDRKSTRLNSSHTIISYAVFCLKKSEVQQGAAVALCAYGALAELAIPAVRKAANDPDEEGRREAGCFFLNIAEPQTPSPFPQPPIHDP